MRRALLGALLLGSACGEPLRVQPPSAPSELRDVRLPGGEVVRAPVRAVRILPCNASAVDFLLALADPERVLALPQGVEAYATFAGADPAWLDLPRMPDLETETVLARGPDLVLTHAWQDASAAETLRASGIPVARLAETHEYAGLRDTLLALGELLDERERAAALAADLDARVARLEERRAAGRTALTYSNFGTGGWTAGARTTADLVIRLAGLENAASAAGIEGNGRIDAERLLELDPDFVVVSRPAPGAGERERDPTPALLRGDPVLSRLAAVRAGRVIELDPRLLLADSQRLVDAAEVLAGEVERLLSAERDGGR